MNHLRIRSLGKGKTQIELNGKPIDLHRLTDVKLDMSANDGNTLTLKYSVIDIDIELDDVDVIEED